MLEERLFGPTISILNVFRQEWFRVFFPLFFFFLVQKVGELVYAKGKWVQIIGMVHGSLLGREDMIFQDALLDWKKSRCILRQLLL
jgi:hypothetical protein